MADNPQQSQERVPYLTPKEGENLPQKEVSTKAHGRLKLAANAIEATKKAIQHQGNQIPALKASNMNSFYRLLVMRDALDQPCWEYTTPEAAELANENPEADTAAKADLAGGGNCGEHAALAYHYLRLYAKGDKIQTAAKSGLDHAFVIMGDLKGDTDQDLVVSDPWPNKPTACLWEDHFAYCARKDIEVDMQQVADGKSFKAAIAAGLRLTAYGKQAIQWAVSEEETKKETDNHRQNHFWNHEDTVGRGKKFDYQPKPPEQQTPAGRPGQGATQQPGR